MAFRLLVVDDDADCATLLADALRRRGHECRIALTSQAAVDMVAAAPYDLVLTDVRMDGLDGLQLCAHFRATRPQTPTIVMTGYGSMDLAIEALKAGAYDLVLKPVALDALTIAIDRALEVRALRVELQRLRRLVETPTTLGIAGESGAVRELRTLIHQVADSDATVLITGESGSGKELVARAIHEQSGRRDQPFLAVNCAAMPASLLESELFGHVRGAFTDAKQARHGLIRQAERGTLFLDEIGEMPAEMQAKLLRVLQERTVRPVGGDEEIPFQARLITATNRDLDIEVEEKRFREDLYYRINVVHLPVPPLRDRQGDVLLLAQHIIRKVSARTSKHVDGLTTDAATCLLAYDWPGNVRELENCIERAIALARTSELTVDLLPASLRENQRGQMVIEDCDPNGMVTLGEMERRYVRRVLTACGGNKAQAARLLGIDRRSLYRRLAEEDGAPVAPVAASA